MSISEFERRKKSDIELIKRLIRDSVFCDEYPYHDFDEQLSKLTKDILVELDKNRVTNQ